MIEVRLRGVNSLSRQRAEHRNGLPISAIEVGETPPPLMALTGKPLLRQLVRDVLFWPVGDITACLA